MFCEKCQKEYFPNQAWIHTGHGPSGVPQTIEGPRTATEDTSENPKDGAKGDEKANAKATKQRWSKEAYNAYQREYMRRRRANSV